MSDALEQTRRRMEAIKMRELRRDNARLIDAIDDILTAYYTPPCEFDALIDATGKLDAAITAARELIEDMGPEAPRE